MTEQRSLLWRPDRRDSVRPGQPITRRAFVQTSILGAAGLALAQSGCRTASPGAAAAPRPVVAFNTANLVARFTNYRFELKNWGENHPEKNLTEILAQIGGGNEWLGVCIDTGWLGTQGVNAPETIRACGRLVRHVHIKDVKTAGAHETCLLGEGIVDVAGCLAALKAIGYPGVYSWEDEPEDRNPFDFAVRNRQWIEARLG